MAWVLVRYDFPGKRFVDAMVDFPFALPTAVAGLTLTSLFAPTAGSGAAWSRWASKAAFTPLGVVIALTFVGLPFVVRTLQPVLQDLDARSRRPRRPSAPSRWQTFWRVIAADAAAGAC